MSHSNCLLSTYSPRPVQNQGTSKDVCRVAHMGQCQPRGLCPSVSLLRSGHTLMNTNKYSVHHIIIIVNLLRGFIGLFWQLLHFSLSLRQLPRGLYEDQQDRLRLQLTDDLKHLRDDHMTSSLISFIPLCFTESVFYKLTSC